MEYDKLISTLQDGEELEATVIKVSNIRSLLQNKLYWRILETIVDEYADVDIGKYQLHEYFKNKYLCHTEIILGEEVLVCPSTADLSIKEFSSYIQRIEAWAMEKMNISVMTLEDRELL